MDTISPAIREYEDSTPLLAGPDRLRQRIAEDGFLFLRDFIPRELVLELRRRILEIVERNGWMKAGTDIMEGIADRDAIARSAAVESFHAWGTGIPNRVYRDVQCLEQFHALAHHPKFIALYETIFQSGVLIHPRHIARVMLPSPGLSPTPPHQDFIHIQGTTNVWTCWMPLGDCPVRAGGLSVLRGSNQDGLLPVMAAAGAGGTESIICETTHQWAQGDFKLGDIITFPCHTVHKSLPSQLPDRIRLSCDYRFQPAHEDIEEKSLQPHGQIATWEEIYQNWNNKNLMYYWEKRDLHLSPWNESIRWQKERICN